MQMPHLPDETVVKIGDFKIGLCHGHQIIPWGNKESLAQFARQVRVEEGKTNLNKTYSTPIYCRWM